MLKTHLVVGKQKSGRTETMLKRACNIIDDKEILYISGNINDMKRIHSYFISLRFSDVSKNVNLVFGPETTDVINLLNRQGYNYDAIFIDLNISKDLHKFIVECKDALENSKTSLLYFSVNFEKGVLSDVYLPLHVEHVHKNEEITEKEEKRIFKKITPQSLGII